MTLSETLEKSGDRLKKTRFLLSGKKSLSALVSSEKIGPTKVCTSSCIAFSVASIAPLGVPFVSYILKIRFVGLVAIKYLIVLSTSVPADLLLPVRGKSIPTRLFFSGSFLRISSLLGSFN